MQKSENIQFNFLVDFFEKATENTLVLNFDGGNVFQRLFVLALGIRAYLKSYDFLSKEDRQQVLTLRQAIQFSWSQTSFCDGFFEDCFELENSKLSLFLSNESPSTKIKKAKCKCFGEAAGSRKTKKEVDENTKNLETFSNSLVSIQSMLEKKMETQKPKARPGIKKEYLLTDSDFANLAKNENSFTVAQKNKHQSFLFYFWFSRVQLTEQLKTKILKFSTAFSLEESGIGIFCSSLTQKFLFEKKIQHVPLAWKKKIARYPSTSTIYIVTAKDLIDSSGPNSLPSASFSYVSFLHELLSREYALERIVVRPFVSPKKETHLKGEKKQTEENKEERESPIEHALVDCYIFSSCRNRIFLKYSQNSPLQSIRRKKNLKTNRKIQTTNNIQNKTNFNEKYSGDNNELSFSTNFQNCAKGIRHALNMARIKHNVCSGQRSLFYLLYREGLKHAHSKKRNAKTLLSWS